MGMKKKKKINEDVGTSGIAGGFIGGHGQDIDKVFAGPFHPKYGEIDKKLQFQLDDAEEKRKFTEEKTPIQDLKFVLAEMEYIYDEIIEDNKNHFINNSEKMKELSVKELGLDIDEPDYGEDRSMFINDTEQYKIIGEGSMKISKKRIREIIREEIIKEFNPTGAGGYKKAKGDYETVLAKLKPAEKQKTSDHRTYTYAREKHGAHTEAEPTKNISDTTKWIHPHSKITTTLKAGDKQPESGWAYKQHPADTTKWIHPGSGVTHKIGKGEKQPAVGWTRTKLADLGNYIHPYSGQQDKLPKGYDSKNPDLVGWQEVPSLELQQKGAKTKYGIGTQADYKKLNQMKPDIGWTRSDAAKAGPRLDTYGQGSVEDYKTAVKKAGEKFEKEFSPPQDTTNPYDMLALGKTAYGQGSALDYSTARLQAAAKGQSKHTDALKTTNPSTTNPKWSTWSDTADLLKKTVDSAYTAKQDSYGRWKDIVKKLQSSERAKEEKGRGLARIKPPKTVAGFGFGRGSKGTSGFGKGKAAGKGKGKKGKKKDLN